MSSNTPLVSNYKYGDSVFKGETWNAFKPGQDKAFPENWVSRRKNKTIGDVMSRRKDLVENAKRLGVKLKWRKESDERHGFGH